MLSDTLEDFMKPTFCRLVTALKRSDGLSVTDLSEQLEMSYMGVKEQCKSLAKKGYLAERRKPTSGVLIGRPPSVYCLTPKCDVLFPELTTDLTLNLLENSRDLFGGTSAERLILRFFQSLEESWEKPVAKFTSLAAKAKKLVELREKSGWFSRLSAKKDGTFTIQDYHSPLAKLNSYYPKIERLESHLISELLEAKVTCNTPPDELQRGRALYEIYPD